MKIAKNVLQNLDLFIHFGDSKNSFDYFKAFVICVFVLYLGGAIFGCMRVKEGLEKRRLSRYDSYSVEFYDLEDEYFRVYPYSIQVSKPTKTTTKHI